jgi:predicted lysophospholipase L1 biosynthesis ABC-type transport system permease subunit
VPLYNVRPLETNVATSLGTQRIVASLTTIFAGLAFAMSVVGLYSVLAYAVSQRTAEIGVRLALGARPWQVVRTMVGETLGIAAISVAAATAIVVLIDLHLVRGGMRDLPALAGTPAASGRRRLASWLPPAAPAHQPIIAMRSRE